MQLRFDVGENGNRVDETIEHLRELAELGIQVAHGGVPNATALRQLEVMAERVIPAVPTSRRSFRRCLYKRRPTRCAVCTHTTSRAIPFGGDFGAGRRG